MAGLKGISANAETTRHGRMMVHAEGEGRSLRLSVSAPCADWYRRAHGRAWPARVARDYLHHGALKPMALMEHDPQDRNPALIVTSDKALDRTD